MIDITIHRQILLNILKDLYQDKNIASWLGFKGGTCLYFFYELPRFSVDLDFNLLHDSSKFNPSKISTILEKYVKIKDYFERKSTFFWLGSYEKTHHNVKIEISRRNFDDEYELRNIYGLTVKCMSKPYLFAHKLCAIHDRNKLVNRDLFDSHFMFQKQFPIAEKIILKRTGMSIKEYFKLLIDYIPHNIPQPNILQGLGELLTGEQKLWVKNNLVDDILFYLKSRI